MAAWLVVLANVVLGFICLGQALEAISRPFPYPLKRIQNLKK